MSELNDEKGTEEQNGTTPEQEKEFDTKLDEVLYFYRKKGKTANNVYNDVNKVLDDCRELQGTEFHVAVIEKLDELIKHLEE